MTPVFVHCGIFVRDEPVSPAVLPEIFGKPQGIGWFQKTPGKLFRMYRKSVQPDFRSRVKTGCHGTSCLPAASTFGCDGPNPTVLSRASPMNQRAFRA
jgi:hypothetical protein